MRRVFSQSLYNGGPSIFFLPPIFFIEISIIKVIFKYHLIKCRLKFQCLIQHGICRIPPSRTIQNHTFSAINLLLLHTNLKCLHPDSGRSHILHSIPNTNCTLLQFLQPFSNDQIQYACTTTNMQIISIQH